MASLVPLVMTEGNDETVAITIDRQFMAQDLMAVTEVIFYLKDDNCDPDAGAHVLSSTDVSQLKILTQTSAQITAEAYVPAAWLAGAYPRTYHVDALAPGARRTAVYGPITVNNV